jgi:hypothetical protein
MIAIHDAKVDGRKQQLQRQGTSSHNVTRLSRGAGQSSNAIAVVVTLALTSAERIRKIFSEKRRR